MGAWSDRVDERVELAVPPLGELVEHPLNLVGVGGVGHQTEHVRTSAGSEIIGRLVQHRFRPADDGDLRPVLGQTAGGRVPHSAATADDYRSRVRKTEIHDRPVGSRRATIRQKSLL